MGFSEPSADLARAEFGLVAKASKAFFSEPVRLTKPKMGGSWNAIAPKAGTNNQIALRGGSLMRESPSLW
jgi:hypothetical protein